VGMSPVRIGLNLYPQQTTFEDLARAAETADRNGCDSLWIWDHLCGVAGADQNVFELWTTLSAIACRTERATVGSLVSSNTFRHPGLLAKSAVTVDHVGRGRLVLGVGAGYQEAEHAAFGIDMGTSRAQRIEWLEESLGSIKRLLAAEEVSSEPGGRYALERAVVRPVPFRGRGSIPLMLGGGSPGIVRLVSRFADLWHTRGSVASLRRRLDRLRSECAEAGREPSEIELCIGNPVVIRDDQDEALAVYEAGLAHNGQTLATAPGEPWVGPPRKIAELWRPFVELGFRHLIADLPSPHDRETLLRLAEVRDQLAGGQ
jgi:alkanesulfonate monooxygenase SsuD/methylene tetrahydromethanopterin reductase-like flavin-dependent oxidoreductase (luciferase family)